MGDTSFCTDNVMGQESYLRPIFHKVDQMKFVFLLVVRNLQVVWGLWLTVYNILNLENRKRTIRYSKYSGIPYSRCCEEVGLELRDWCYAMACKTCRQNPQRNFRKVLLHKAFANEFQCNFKVDMELCLKMELQKQTLKMDKVLINNIPNCCAAVWNACGDAT